MRVSGRCQRCGIQFAGDQLVTIVRKGLDRSWVGSTPKWVAVCADCASPAEAAAAEYQLDCRGCGQPMATPHPHYSFEREDRPWRGSMRYKVCSERCAQRWRRRRQRADRPASHCQTCGTAFVAARGDTRFCSNACRQSAYRRRVATGEKIEPLEHADELVIHLDEVAGVLHYRNTPIIALTGLYRSWEGFGNRPRLSLATRRGPSSIRSIRLSRRASSQRQSRLRMPRMQALVNRRWLGVLLAEMPAGPPC